MPGRPSPAIGRVPGSGRSDKVGGRCPQMREVVVARFAVIVVIVLVVGLLVPTAVLAVDASCWGQATRVFAQAGEMGAHASQEPTPRLGLRNLARALYDQDVIDDDSMAALGVFVSDALGLSIEACMD